MASTFRMAIRTAFVLIAYLPLCTVSAQSADFSGSQSDAILEFLEIYAGHRNRYLPELSIGDIDDLNAGRALVKAMDAPDDSQDEETSEVGIVGLKIVEAPRLLVWLALLVDSEELDGRLTRAVLSEGHAGSIVRYQHINLPWPIKDRHWVIQCDNNLDIAGSSDGRIWERHWSLHGQGRQLVDSAHADGTIVGVTRRNLDGSIYLPSNRGSWTLFDLGPKGTLVAAYVAAQLGGRISDGLVRSFTKRQLRVGLATLQEISAQVHGRYDERPFVHDGWGMPISKDDALGAAHRWREQRALAQQSSSSDAD